MIDIFMWDNDEIIIDNSMWDEKKISNTFIYDGKNTKTSFYKIWAHKFFKKFKIHTDFKNQKIESNDCDYENHQVRYVIFIWMHWGVVVYLNILFIQNVINCDCFNLIFIGVFVYIYNLVFNLSQMLWFIFWITVSIENNIIYKHFKFVLFTEIIILLKMLFLDHEEEDVRIEDKT